MICRANIDQKTMHDGRKTDLITRGNQKTSAEKSDRVRLWSQR